MGKRLTEYFFDTYALQEIEEGSENYAAYSGELGIVTTKLNLMELYHNYFKLKGKDAAELSFEHFKDFCLDINDDVFKEAAVMRAQLKKESKSSNVSYVDCIGYVIAKKLKIKFLTGDREFETLENVEFVK